MKGIRIEFIVFAFLALVAIAFGAGQLTDHFKCKNYCKPLPYKYSGQCYCRDAGGLYPLNNPGDN